MKKKKDISAETANLWLGAEDHLNATGLEVHPSTAEPDVMRLNHELQVHQIELEMQNEELEKIRSELESSLESYTNLYDFAPVAYFTLDRQANILQVNLAGAKLLETPRSRLINRGFCSFVSPESRSLFNAFLNTVFESYVRQISKVDILTGTGDIQSIQMDAVISGDAEECRVAVLIVPERKQAQEALANKQAELKAIYDHAPVMMCLMDMDKQVRYANPAFTASLDVSNDVQNCARVGDVLGCINSQDDPRGCGFGTNCQDCTLRLALDDTIKNGTEHHNVERSITLINDRNQRVVTLLGSTTLIKETGNNELLLCLQDITEHKQTERTLHELRIKIGSQEIYTLLVEMASDGFWLLDKEFKTIYVNPAMEKMLGYFKEEMIGRSWYDFGDPEWVLRAKELENRRESGVKEPHDFLFIHKNGRKVLTRIATTPLYDGDDNFSGALGVLSDITRQKEAEDALEIKDMLNAIAESAEIGMCIINPDYTIAWYNELYAKWFGVLEQTKGRNCFEVFEGRDAICPECPAKVSFETGSVVVTERSGLTTSSGNDRIFALSSSPILDPYGNVIQAVEITQDITERKQAEQEKRQFYRDTIRSVTQGKLDLVSLEEVKEYLGPAGLILNVDSPADCASARSRIMEFCSSRGLVNDRLGLFELAIGEAITNATKHADGCRVYAGVSGETIWVAISDTGQGISHSLLPSATLRRGFSSKVSMGMGFTIMMDATDNIMLCTGLKGTTVVLSVNLNPSESAMDNFPDFWDEITDV